MMAIVLDSWKLLREAAKQRPLYVLCTIDLIIIAISLAREAVALLYPTYHGQISGPFFAITTDRGLGELWQYLKEAIAVGLCATIGRLEKNPVWYVFAAFFLYILLDDSLEIHERLGHWFSMSTDGRTIGAFNAQDAGELLATMIVVAVVCPAIAFYIYRRSQTTRSEVLGLIVLILALGGFGVVIDVLKSSVWFPEYVPVDRLAHILHEAISHIEDGGELIVMSWIITYLAIVSQVFVNAVQPPLSRTVLKQHHE